MTEMWHWSTEHKRYCRKMIIIEDYSGVRAKKRLETGGSFILFDGLAFWNVNCSIKACVDVFVSCHRNQNHSLFIPYW